MLCKQGLWLKVLFCFFIFTDYLTLKNAKPSLLINSDWKRVLSSFQFCASQKQTFDAWKCQLHGFSDVELCGRWPATNKKREAAMDDRVWPGPALTQVQYIIWVLQLKFILGPKNIYAWGQSLINSRFGWLHGCFYRRIFYKNEARICPKIKNKLRSFEARLQQLQVLLENTIRCCKRVKRISCARLCFSTLNLLPAAGYTLTGLPTCLRWQLTGWK